MLHQVDFAVSVDHRRKMKEGKKIDNYLDLSRDVKRNHEGDGDRNYCWFAWKGLDGLGKKSGRIGNQ